MHHNSTLLRYFVSLLGYGFYGDIIKDSEKKRWMGLARYNFSGNSRQCSVSRVFAHASSGLSCTAPVRVETRPSRPSRPCRYQVV